MDYFTVLFFFLSASDILNIASVYLNSEELFLRVQDTENRTKLNALIQFPLYGLDMSHRMEIAGGVNNNVDSTASDEFIYDLYAVCNHFGNLQGGHYTGKLCSSVDVF